MNFTLILYLLLRATFLNFVLKKQIYIICKHYAAKSFRAILGSKIEPFVTLQVILSKSVFNWLAKLIYCVLQIDMKLGFVLRALEASEITSKRNKNLLYYTRITSNN